MKYLLALIINLLVFHVSFGQWTQKSDIPSVSRIGPASFVIGTTAYIAGGRDSFQNYLNDFWSYNSVSDSWTQKASFPGSGRLEAGGFAINNFGYLCDGWLNGSIGTTDLLKYDPVLNSWTIGLSFPGGGRYGPTAFVINDKAYIGLGYAPLYDDLWEFNPSTNIWTQKASFPSGPRQAFVNFAISGFGYVGSGIDQNGLNNGYTGLNNFYKYDPLLNSWTAVSSIPGSPRHSAFSFVIDSIAYVGCGLNGNLSSATLFNDFYQYNATTDTWTLIQALPSNPRQSGTAFAIGNCGYIFSGLTQSVSGNTYHKDLWQFCSSVGIVENGNEIQFKIYFDSNKNSFHITYQNNFDQRQFFQIFGIDGKIIQTKYLKESFGNFVSEEIPANPIAKGIYMYTIKNSERIIQSGKISID